MKTLALIGDGIAARAFLYHFYLEKLQEQFELTQFYAPDYAPAVSESSTGIVALRGVERGVSPLGDSIFQSYHDFKNFVNVAKPRGVERVTHATCWSCDSSNDQKYSKRFPNFEVRERTKYYEEEAYLIYPAELLASLASNLTHKREKTFILNVERQDGLWIVGAETDQKFDYLVVCAGSYAPWILADARTQKTKPIQGSFLVWKLNEKLQSFAMSFEEINIIYREQTRELLIGSTTVDSGYSFIPEKEQLRELYNKYAEHFKPSFLPSFEAAKIITGLRHKGPQRKPFWGQSPLGPQAFQVDSLYKNGWSFAFTAALDITRALKAAVV